MTRPLRGLLRTAAFAATSAMAILGPLGCGAAAPPAPATRAPPGAPPPTRLARGSDPDDARAAGAALDAWHDAAARSDEEAYFALFDEEGVFLGTDVTEHWDKKALRAYAHAPFSSGRGWTFKPTRRALRVWGGGELAFFDEDLTSAKFPPTRGSGVLVRRSDGWRVLQYVLSMTIPNDRFDAVKDDATAALVLAPEGKLSQLGWLAGTWASEDLAVELTWSQARASTMVGTLRIGAIGPSAAHDATAGVARSVATHTIDALRIEATDTATIYTAERRGRAALRYDLEPEPKPPSAAAAPGAPEVRPREEHVTFVDAPNQVRLTFSREADALRIVVERKGKVEETTLLRRAAIMRR